MLVDSFKVFEVMVYLYFLVVFVFIQLIVFIFFFYQVMGLSVIFGFIVMVLFFLINIVFGKGFNKIQKKIMSVIDKCIYMINEVL